MGITILIDVFDDGVDEYGLLRGVIPIHPSDRLRRMGWTTFQFLLLPVDVFPCRIGAPPPCFTSFDFVDSVSCTEARLLQPPPPPEASVIRKLHQRRRLMHRRFRTFFALVYASRFFGSAFFLFGRGYQHLCLGCKQLVCKCARGCTL